MHCHPTFYNYLPRREGILLAKARIYRWTTCNWFLKQIGKRKCGNCDKKPDKATCSSCEECETCHEIDDTGHVLDDCTIHDGPRSLMLQKIGCNTGKVTDLITSNNKEYIKVLGRYLVEVEDTRQLAEEAQRAHLSTAALAPLTHNKTKTKGGANDPNK